MKKRKQLLLSALLVIALIGSLSACSGGSAANTGQDQNTTTEAEISDNKTGVTIDYGTSDLYTKEDMDDGINLILNEFNSWNDGCEMHSIRYAGDEADNDQNIKWVNELKEGQNFSQCMEFMTNFHSPKEEAGAWEPDTEYEDYEWYLARSDGGDWQLVSWGY